MGKQSSDIGWRRKQPPGTGPPHLFAVYCDACQLASSCGEKETSSACGHPTEYESEDFHPAKDLLLPQDLAFPPPPRPGNPTLPPAMIVAKAFVGSQGGLLGVHADRLTGRRFQSVENGLAVLLGNDKHLLKLWDHRAKLGQRLRDAGFNTAITPSFSMYWHSPSYDGLLTMRLAAGMALLLSREISVIPTINWRTELDLRNWVRWLEGGNVRCFAVHFSVATAEQWTWMLNGIEMLNRLFSHPTHLVAVGISSVGRIQRLAIAWDGPLTIASGKPWQAAQKGRSLGSDLREVRRKSRTKAQLVDENTATFLSVTEALTRQPQLSLVS